MRRKLCWKHASKVTLKFVEKEKKNMKQEIAAVAFL